MIAADQLLRIPLAPLLIAQGLGVRRRAHTLSEPPGQRHGSTGTGPQLRLLIIGDSAAAGVGASHQNTALAGQLVAELSQSHSVTWQLEAATSATTPIAIRHLETIAPFQADVVVSSLGVNDTTRGFSHTTWRTNQSALLDLLTAKFGARHVIASGLPPMGAYPKIPQPLRWVIGQQAARLDAALADLATQYPTLEHLALDIPFEPRFQATDGYHPSEAAYTLWAKLLAPRIRAAL